MTQKRILLLSAYDAESHRYWHQQLVAGLPEHDWTVLALSDRFFAWRASGNALSFQDRFHNQLIHSYDLVIATSVVDLASLRGVYPNLASCPNVLYFHENQMAYPPNTKQRGQAERELRQIQSSVAADQLVFNSAYNRDSFLDGVNAFGQRMPDGFPVDLAGSIAAKSEILPVPIKADCRPRNTKKQAKNALIEVVWNHRWEHDKGPEVLLAVMQQAQGLNLKFHILGRQFRQRPEAMQQIMDQHADQCLTLGYVANRAEYIGVLQLADVVLSTAWHDFQGVSMLEAVACGCVPLAPDRLVYPELYPQSNLYSSTPQDSEAEARAILNRLRDEEKLSPVSPMFLWPQMEREYQKWMGGW